MRQVLLHPPTSILNLECYYSRHRIHMWTWEDSGKHQGDSYNAYGMTYKAVDCVPAQDAVGGNIIAC